MKLSVKISLLLFAFLGVNAANAQSCRDEHTYCDRGKDKGWQTSTQSKSGTFAAGETHEISLIIYDGIDYRFSFCANNPELDGQIVVEMFTEKTVRKYIPEKRRMGYVKEKESRYTNREDEMAQSFEIQADGTKKIFLRVTVPDGPSEGGRGRKLKASDVICVGVLVQHQKGVRSGFKGGEKVETEGGGGF